MTVLEKSPAVITLVAPHYQQQFGARFAVIHADAFTWQPPQGIRYAVVWHDIWTYFLPENLIHMDMLEQHYQPVADGQGCWGKELSERIRTAETKAVQWLTERQQQARSKQG